MLNRLLKTKVSYVKSTDELVDKFNFLVKTLNSSTQNSLDQQSQVIDQISLNGVEISQSFSGPAGTLFTTFVINHGLGSIPSGYIINDYEYSSGALAAEMHSISRVSWTNSQITIRLNITTGTGTAFAGSFKILVLR